MLAGEGLSTREKMEKEEVRRIGCNEGKGVKKRNDLVGVMIEEEEEEMKEEE